MTQKIKLEDALDRQGDSLAIRLVLADNAEETATVLHREATAVDIFVNDDDEILGVTLHLGDIEGEEA